MKEKSNEKENEKSSKEVLTEGDKFGILLKLSQDSRAERKAPPKTIPCRTLNCWKNIWKNEKSCWQWVADAVLLKSSRQASEVRKGHEHWKLHSVEIWVIDCLGWNAEGSKYESRNMYDLNWYMHSFRQFLNHNSNNSGFEFWRMPSVNEFKNQTDYSSESSVIQFY